MKPLERVAEMEEQTGGAWKGPRRRSRGANSNPANRFERLALEPDPGADDGERRKVATELFRDHSKSILATNDSPDIPFTYSLNPYRGCEHGCIYCYARPSHEFLGFSAGTDFESRIIVKEDAPRLLEQTFRRRSWTPQVISISGNTDPYQPIERKLKITRGVLEVCLAHRNPVSIITKNQLITRDLDLLEEMASMGLVHVMLSITSLRPEITAAMEPRTSRPSGRMKAVEELSARGVPVGVMVAPVVPGLTDEEMPAILKEAAARGAQFAGYTMLRLPGAVEGLFAQWLEETFLPARAEKIMNRLLEIRGDDLGGGSFGKRMTGDGIWADLIRQIFRKTCGSLGLNRKDLKLETQHFRRLRPGQGELF